MLLLALLLLVTWRGSVSGERGGKGAVRWRIITAYLLPAWCDQKGYRCQWGHLLILLILRWHTRGEGMSYVITPPGPPNALFYRQLWLSCTHTVGVVQRETETFDAFIRLSQDKSQSCFPEEKPDSKNIYPCQQAAACSIINPAKSKRITLSQRYFFLVIFFPKKNLLKGFLHIFKEKSM